MTDAPPDERFISWTEIQDDARALSRRLLDRADTPSWKGIVAITRGGLPPATILAREMAIRIVDTLSIASYDEQTQGKVRVLKTPESAVADKGAGWLLVDDLVDTGATAKAARALLPQALFVTLYAKPAGKALADLYMHDVGQDTWIHFPWDTELHGDGPAYAPPMTHEAAT